MPPRQQLQNMVSNLVDNGPKSKKIDKASLMLKRVWFKPVQESDIDEQENLRCDKAERRTPDRRQPAHNKPPGRKL